MKPRWAKLFIGVMVALGAWTPARSADIEYYRKQLATVAGLTGNNVEFLLCNLPQALGDPADTNPDGSPADVAFMDYVPYEQYDWAPSRSRVSAVYSSIFVDYVLGFRRRSSEELAGYMNALSRLYQSPDPALVLRGQLPALRPTDRALDYFTKNEVTLKRVISGDLWSAGIDGVIDAVVTAGAAGEIRDALRAIREFQRNDTETQWSARASSLASEVYPVAVTPSRPTWNDASGWATMVIPSSHNPAIAVSLQVKQITITRPWMDESVFEAHDWYQRDGNGKIVPFSTGEALTDSNGKISGSQMLLLPVQFLLARKVERIGTWTLADEQTLPLSLRPSVDDPAIGSTPVVIAVICKRVPRCPQPDPNLDWPQGLPKE